MKLQTPPLITFLTRVQHAWEIVKTPFLTYWIFRFYYSTLVAGVIFMFRRPREEPSGYFDFFSQYFLMGWNRWDTPWYLQIAQQGYKIANASSVFPPFYPYLIRGLNEFLGDYLLAALTISTVAGCCATILLYLMTKEAFGKEAGNMAVLLLLAFPTSVFFFGGYTEPLFLVFSLGMFIAAKNGKFGLASFLATLATLTRYQGAVLALPLGWMIWKSANDQNRLWKTLIYSAIPILFLSAFLWVRNEWIDPTPINKMYEQYWKSSFGVPGESLVASIKMLPYSLNLHYFINWIDFGLLAIVIFVTPMIMRTLPMEYWLYQVGTLFVLLLRIGPVDNPLQGMGRYMLLMFPALMAISRGLHNRVGRLFLILSFLLATWVTVIFVLVSGIIS